MNYLSHAFLSGDDPRVLAGNLLADLIKGTPDPRLHPNVRKGIALHRKQDAFTDSHPAFKQSRRRLNGDFRHYSAVVVDVLYDHLMAINLPAVFDQSLKTFVSGVDQSFHDLRDEIAEVYTPKWSTMLWLEHYATMDGLERAFGRITKRSRNGVDLTAALHWFETERDGFQEDFMAFLPDIVDYTDACLKTL